MLFGVYHYWVHQNTGNYLNFRIIEDGKWQTRRNKLVFFPTKGYVALYGKVKNKCVTTLSVELDHIHARKWNTKRVIIFQSIILQRIQPVTDAKSIRA